MAADQKHAAFDDRPVEFGTCSLDRASGQLKRDGHIIPLTPRAFAVLDYLVAHAGRLVTKQELFDAIWSDAFVGDAALKVCIREIRRALDDDARQPQYIETAHRRGYRFIAPVTPRPPLASAAPSPADGVAAPKSVAGATPATHYARSGDVNIAYQVIGHGAIDLVFVMGWVSHLDCTWTEPAFARFLRRLAEFARVIIFDKRGTGLSDRVAALPTLEQRMDDVRAVMAAAGSREAVLLGVSEGGPMCTLFATTYPERTRALVMFGTYAKRRRADDYPWGQAADAGAAFLAEIAERWGGPVGIETRAPSRATDPAFRAWWSSYLRQGASPGAAVSLTQMNSEIDVRHVLPLVRVPTLVMHRAGDQCLLVEEGRYVASLIPGAQFVELEGDDHLPFVGDQDTVVDRIAAFVASAVRAEPADRLLATVVCGGLTSPAEDRAKRAAFETHVRQEIAWLRGRDLTLAPDGFVAAFDGPARAISCARALAAAAPRFGLAAAFGLHTGECDVTRAGRVGGAAVERARAVQALAAPGEVLVSRTVTDLVAGSGLTFADRGAYPLVPGGEPWHVFAVEDGRVEPSR